MMKYRRAQVRDQVERPVRPVRDQVERPVRAQVWEDGR